jgi:hypothetical protein
MSEDLEEVVDYLYTMVEEMASNNKEHKLEEIIAAIGQRCEWAE